MSNYILHMLGGRVGYISSLSLSIASLYIQPLSISISVCIWHMALSLRAPYRRRAKEAASVTVSTEAV